MNIVIITAILSTANASLYTTSRVLWHIGKAKEGPSWLQRTNGNNIPLLAIGVSAVFSIVCVISSVLGSGLVFHWLLNIIGLVGYIAWFGICLCHYRFRRAYIIQGKSLDQLTFKAKWFPFAPILAMSIIGMIVIGQEIMAVATHQASWQQFITTYIGLGIFLIMLSLYKWRHKTRWLALEDIDLNNESQ